MNAVCRRKLAKMEAFLNAHYVTPAQFNGIFLPVVRGAIMEVVFPYDPQAAQHLLAELDCLVMDLNEGRLSHHVAGVLCERDDLEANQ